MACNGQLLSISEYEALYSLIGTTYGGSGTDFALPNLQGLLVAGTGQGVKLSNYAMGVIFGGYDVNLQQNQALHVHNLLASTAPATSLSPGNMVFAAAPTGYATYVSNPADTTQRQLDPRLLANTGGSQAHSNMMPSVAFNYIICVQGGQYPDFN